MLQSARTPFIYQMNNNRAASVSTNDALRRNFVLRAHAVVAVVVSVISRSDGQSSILAGLRSPRTHVWRARALPNTQR